MAPLSQKPFGYALAVLGGVAGGPIGMVASPLVLFGLNRILKKNRFLAWAAIGIIGAPLSLAPLGVFSPQRAVNTPTIGESGAIPGVTLSNYGKLKPGMTYEEVVGILGEKGTEMSSNDVGGYKTVMYIWKAGGFSIGNMTVIFQNGALMQKAQYELP